MAVDQLYAGNANTFLLQDFRDAISGAFESDVIAFMSICEKPPNGITWLVEGASTEDPVVITSTAHGLSDGEFVTIVNVGDNRAAHGTYSVTVIDDDSFSLDGCDGTSAAEWTRGGQFFRCLPDCNGLPFSVTGVGQYALTVDGNIGLVVRTEYVVVFYCTGAYRDLYNEVDRVVAIRRGNY